MSSKGVLKFGGAVILGRALQIFAFIFMARWLSKEQMGVVGLLAAIFAGMYSLTNLGFDRYLIHTDREDRAHVMDSLDVIWSLQVVRGLFTLFLSLLCGLIMAQFTQFGTGMLLPTFGIGFALFVYNLQNPGIVLFERNGNFNYLGKIRSLAFIVSSLVIILSIPFVMNEWVYVSSQIVNCLIYTGLSYYYSEVRPAWRFDPKAIREVFSYCKSILLISVVSFIAAQFESFYVGFLFGPLILGYYFTWARVINLPREILSQFLDQVLFPKACALRRTGGDIDKLHLSGFMLSVTLVFPVYFFVWFHGDIAMSLMAGQGWDEYLWLGKFFIAISGLFMVCTTISPFILAYYPRESGYIRAAEALLLVILMFFLGHYYGLIGVLYASLASILCATVVRLYILYRYLIVVRRVQHFRLSVNFVLINSVPFSLLEYGLSGIDGMRRTQSILVCSYVLAGLLTVALCGLYFRHLKINGRLLF